MSISPHQQWIALLWALPVGALCGILYDLIRISRVLLGISVYTKTGSNLDEIALPLVGKGHGRENARRTSAVQTVFVALGDVVFGLLCAAVFCVYLHHAASGQFRLMYFLGFGCGFGIYYLTLGRLVMLSSEILSFLLKSMFRYAVWFLLFPLRLIGRGVYRLASVFVRRLWMPMLHVLFHAVLRRYTEHQRKRLAVSLRLRLPEFENERSE